MTREEVIRMAREAYGDWYPNAVPHELERFAALVAAAEREACAQQVQNLVDHRVPASEYPNRIRARGQE